MLISMNYIAKCVGRSNNFPWTNCRIWVAICDQATLPSRFTPVPLAFRGSGFHYHAYNRSDRHQSWTLLPPAIRFLNVQKVNLWAFIVSCMKFTSLTAWLSSKCDVVTELSNNKQTFMISNGAGGRLWRSRHKSRGNFVRRSKSYIRNLALYIQEISIHKTVSKNVLQQGLRPLRATHAYSSLQIAADLLFPWVSSGICQQYWRILWHHYYRRWNVALPLHPGKEISPITLHDFS